MIKHLYVNFKLVQTQCINEIAINYLTVKQTKHYKINVCYPFIPLKKKKPNKHANRDKQERTSHSLINLSQRLSFYNNLKTCTQTFREIVDKQHH